VKERDDADAKTKTRGEIGWIQAKKLRQQKKFTTR
jgi:hypothetical protein